LRGVFFDLGKTRVTITPELLLHAYRNGLFPMAQDRDDPELFWVEPRRRGVIPLDGFHISRSLAKRLKRMDYSVTLNQNFARVMMACADRPETWINDEIHQLYNEIHQQGHAHSLEVWQDDQMIGGVYGGVVGAAFCGESMFSRARDGSKIALAWMVDHLNRTGFRLFDTQFITSHLASLGAQEIPRAQYMDRLEDALLHAPDLLSKPLAACGHDVVQRNAQTS
jgi:leucyl/phenylalanyl-tRNA--protein transferase